MSSCRRCCRPMHFDLITITVRCSASIRRCGLGNEHVYKDSGVGDHSCGRGSGALGRWSTRSRCCVSAVRTKVRMSTIRDRRAQLPYVRLRAMPASGARELRWMSCRAALRGRTHTYTHTLALIRQQPSPLGDNSTRAQSSSFRDREDACECLAEPRGAATHQRDLRSRSAPRRPRSWRGRRLHR